MTNPLQVMADAIGAEGKRTRAKYQLTLGKLIKSLESSNQRATVECTNGISPGAPHSYRGYYSDLAFELNDPTVVNLKVKDFLAVCRKVLDTTLEGYKGGDFVMDADTPLWLSAWGEADDVAMMDVMRKDDETVLIVVKSLED